MPDEAVTDSTEEAPKAPAKKGKLPLLIGVALAVALGAGGFYATYSGMLFGSSGFGASAGHDSADENGNDHTPVAFVPIEPILVSLPQAETPRHLRFRAELETTPEHAHDLELLMPRVLDVLNGYLRAVSTEDLERPTALIRLRAQMLRRVRLVAGDTEVRDLLVTEFVLN